MVAALATLGFRMRRLALALGLLCSALALGACGSDEAGGPLDEALGFLPADAPLAVVIDTDSKSGQYEALRGIIDRFPLGDQAVQSLRGRLEKDGNTDFERDIKPILGNPLVVGAVDAKALGDSEHGSSEEGRYEYRGEDDKGQGKAGEDGLLGPGSTPYGPELKDRDRNELGTTKRSRDEYVAVIKAKDKDKLDALLKKQRLEEDGEKDGAKLYKGSGGDFLAVKDDMLVLAGSKKLLDGALAQSEKGGGLEQDTLDKGLEGLPRNALVKIYADVEALVKSDAGSKDAQRVEWVKALRKFGMTASAESDALRLDFKLGTEGDLSEADLPIASGEQSPSVVKRAGEIAFGIRDPSQIVAFAESAGQAVDPAGFGQYTTAKKQIERQLGVNIDDDLVAQLSGDTSINVALDGKYGLRAELKDAAKFKRTLDKVAGELPGVIASTGGGKVDLAEPKSADGFYELTKRGGETVVFGVVDEVFVLADDPARAGELARQSPSAVAGAKGSAVMYADARKIAEQLIAELYPQAGVLGGLGSELFAGALGDLTGSMSADENGLKGNLKLAIE